MKNLYIVIKVMIRYAIGSFLSISLAIGGAWSIGLSILGGANIDKQLNLIGGLIMLAIGAVIFWKLIGTEIIAEIEKKNNA